MYDVVFVIQQLIMSSKQLVARCDHPQLCISQSPRVAMQFLMHAHICLAELILAIVKIHQFAKLKSPQKFPAIRYVRYVCNKTALFLC